MTGNCVLTIFNGHTNYVVCVEGKESFPYLLRGRTSHYTMALTTGLVQHRYAISKAFQSVCCRFHSSMTILLTFTTYLFSGMPDVVEGI